MFQKTYRIIENQVCGKCQGNGTNHYGTTCTFCNGYGLLRVQKDTVVTITPREPIVKPTY